MKVHLLYEDRDFDPGRPRPANEGDLVEDLALETLLRAMAGGDQFLLDVARKLILAELDDPDEIRYRQAVLQDSVRNSETVRQMYAIAVEAIDRNKHEWFFGERRPEGMLNRSVRVLGIFVELLKKLRVIADGPTEGFLSDGFRTLFETLSGELGDAYLKEIEQHLRRLDSSKGVLMSAHLGDGNVGTGYVLRRPHRPRLLEQLLGDRSGCKFEIDPRDEGGSRALSELRGRGIALAASALARSADHILSFFVMLRFELGFYVACLNLHERLRRQGQALCFPEPMALASVQLNARGLYDPCLSLAGVQPVVGSDVDLAGKELLVITGANRGGKSTFLRALGLAQLMMQSGIFVAADSYRASVCTGVFSHYRRQEDATMTRGKLDEELNRMGAMVDSIRPGSLVLFNESFASTNEREGSEIARQIVHALLDSGVKVAYVTHMYDLAYGFWAEKRNDALFLRAERLLDGTRTFRLAEGEPLPTSHGEDLFWKIFGAADQAEFAESRVPLQPPT